MSADHMRTIAIATIAMLASLANGSTASAAFAWTIDPPPSEISLRPGEAIPIAISVTGDVPATNVRLLQTALVEQDTKRLIALELCRERTGACVPPAEWATGSTGTVWIRPVDFRNGHFIGTVGILSTEDPTPRLDPLTIHMTSGWAQLFGVAAILVGVAGAWFVGVYLRGRNNRAELLLPAIALAERKGELLSRLAPPDGLAEPAKTKERLAAIDRDLSEKSLQDRLSIPRIGPSAFGPVQTAITDKYRLFLDATALALDQIGVLVSGIQAAWGLLASHQGGKAKIDAAVAAIDLLTSTLPADHRVAVDGIVSQLRKDLAGPTESVMVGGRESGPRVLRREDVLVQLRSANTLAWIISLALTTAVGTYVLVLNNTGFGLPLDYLLCLFWGFGLPTAGGQLLQMTAGSVPTRVGVVSMSS